MQRYRDADRDPLPTYSPRHDQERERLAELTEAFLAKGGKVEQVGCQMKDATPNFVIDAKRTPVYAHLFEQPEAQQIKVKPAEVQKSVPEPAPAETRVIAQIELPPSVPASPAAASKTDLRKVMRQMRKDASRIMARLEQMRAH